MPRASAPKHLDRQTSPRASFVSPGNQFTSDHVPAPIAPESQPIAELTYQSSIVCGDVILVTDMAQTSEEEGSPLQDDSIILEGPEMANLKVTKISDALDLVPVCKRELVEHTIAHAIGQGLDSLMECCKVFESKYANRKYYQAWLCAYKQAILVGDSAEEEHSEEHLLQGAP